jgi:hypothetical protein
MRDATADDFSDPRKDPDIFDLVLGSAASAARPGRILAAPDDARCHMFVPILPQGRSRTIE